LAGVFSVYSIGTGHARQEPNNTIAELHRSSLDPYKWINDGPSGVFGNAQGAGMDRKVADSVAQIIAARPDTVNLTGHSRGAIICHMIANELGTSANPACRAIARINMVLIDPVNMSVHTQKGKEIRQGVKLGSYVMLAMENVTKDIFPLTTVTPLDDQFKARMLTINMPGTHGSGTQWITSAIGRSVLGMIKAFMTHWGSRYQGGDPSPRELCEDFAGIHVENPVQYDKKGNVAKRQISDDAKGMAVSPFAKLTKKWEKVGKKRDKVISGQFTEMSAHIGRTAVDFRDSPYFFNEFHAACFKSAYPALYGRFAGDFSNQDLVNLELDDIEQNQPNITASLRALGMI
jgi:hypothetical protein